MKFTGTVTELEPSMSLTEYSYELKDVIVSDERIAIEWREYETFGLVLRPIDADSIMYSGVLTVAERPSVKGYYTAYR